MSELKFVCFKSYDDDVPTPVAAFRLRDEAVAYCYSSIRETARRARKKLHVFYMEKVSSPNNYSYLKDIMFCKKWKYYAGILREDLLADSHLEEANLFREDKRKLHD